MLGAQLFGTGPRWRPLSEAFAVLWQAEAWRKKLIQLLELLAERCERRLHPLPWALPVPLRVHGQYSRAEIMAATGCAPALRLGRARCQRRPPQPPREGVLWHQPSQCDLLFITLNKSEALFSPCTRYRVGVRPLALPQSKPEQHPRRRIRRAADGTGGPEGATREPHPAAIGRCLGRSAPRCC
jgi:hypothetical protein